MKHIHAHTEEHLLVPLQLVYASSVVQYHIDVSVILVNNNLN